MPWLVTVKPESDTAPCGGTLVGVTGGTPQLETTRSGPEIVSAVLLKLFVSSDSTVAFWSSSRGPMK